MSDSLLQTVSGFEWDNHNAVKNRDKHQVQPSECEELFFNQPLIIKEDTGHSTNELRFHAMGITASGRTLLIVFTIRGTRIRVISARDMSRKERSVYETYKT